MRFLKSDEKFIDDINHERKQFIADNAESIIMERDVKIKRLQRHVTKLLRTIEGLRTTLKIERLQKK